MYASRQAAMPLVLTAAFRSVDQWSMRSSFARNTQLAKAQKAHRAAQYVRMSTELQRYSIQNQAAAIAAYAQQKSLSIDRTYADEGRNGLRINGRPGLIELIKDVQSGNADFDQFDTEPGRR